MRSRKPRALLFAATAFWGVAAADLAHADASQDAAAAYDRGAAAYDAGDYATAARELSAADERVPSAIALELALKAATRSADAVLAMNLAERADARGQALDAALEARRRLGRQAARVVLVCPPPVVCSGTIGGVPLETGRARWVSPGPVRIVIVGDGREEERAVDLAGGSSHELVPSRTPATQSVSAPVTPPPAAAAVRAGLPPLVVAVGGALTAGLAVGFGASALDTKTQHDAFLRDTSDEAAAARGRNAEIRTNLLLGALSVTALATLALGVFAVDWRAPDRDGAGRSSVRRVAEGAGGPPSGARLP
ncbi:MAG: hypothetical protein IPG50_13905 [Myxococcales bacterium]|nr:hypothetical protein [Myxococcales bacterium]